MNAYFINDMLLLLLCRDGGDRSIFVLSIRGRYCTGVKCREPKKENMKQIDGSLRWKTMARLFQAHIYGDI